MDDNGPTKQQRFEFQLELLLLSAVAETFYPLYRVSG